MPAVVVGAGWGDQFFGPIVEHAQGVRIAVEEAEVIQIDTGGGFDAGGIESQSPFIFILHHLIQLRI